LALTKIDIAIELIIPDNTAFTVLTALRHLGYVDLETVERAEHIILTVDDRAQPSDLVARLARAEVVFNPNKHRLSYAVEGAPPAQPAELEALVSDKDEDNSRLVRLLTTTFGVSGVRGIERAVGWRLRDTHGAASRERLEWACRELLSNRISQRYDIRPRPQATSVRETAAVAPKGGQ
jgi:phosphoribosylformylglycinamidine (FGAM) synthase PurS component